MNQFGSELYDLRWTYNHKGVVKLGTNGRVDANIHQEDQSDHLSMNKMKFP